MTEAVKIALMGLIGSGLGAFSGILINSRVVDYRLSNLEKKVDKHNNLIERTYQIEEELSVQKEKIKVANHRIDDLERERERK